MTAKWVGDGWAQALEARTSLKLHLVADLSKIEG